MTGAPRQLRVFGMRRSGNHAVIDWLRRNLLGETVFLNACAPGDPFRTYALMETPRGDRHGPGFRATRWFAQFDEGREARHHIVSYEDALPEATGAPAGWRTPFATVIVHRAFTNWLASFYGLVTGRARGTALGVRDPAEIAGRFGAYADLLGERAGATAISFDRWTAEPGYRQGRLDALGLPARDLCTGAPSDFGGGSSFGAGAADAAGAPAASAALTERWRAHLDSPGFRPLLTRAAAMPRLMAALRRVYPFDADRLEALA